MVSAPVRVCSHVKSGICETCVNPLAPTVADEKHYVTTFGKSLLAAFRAAGQNPPRRRNRRRKHTHHTPKTNG